MFGWCMWQTMHWLVGIARVNSWRIGWPGCVRGNRRVGRVALVPVWPNLRVRAGVARVAIVRVDDVARGAAGRAIVARAVVGAEEPHERVVEARLVDVEHRHGDARAGAGAAVGLVEVRPARLFEASGSGRANSAGRSPGRRCEMLRPPRSNTRKMSAGASVLPARQRVELRQDAVLAPCPRAVAGAPSRIAALPSRVYASPRM